MPHKDPNARNAWRREYQKRWRQEHPKLAHERDHRAKLRRHAYFAALYRKPEYLEAKAFSMYLRYRNLKKRDLTPSELETLRTAWQLQRLQRQKQQLASKRSRAALHRRKPRRTN
jgi:hypothetical protein